MTHIFALILILSTPLFFSIFRKNRKYRLWGFSCLSALPFLIGLPITGYLYDWPSWFGTVKGIVISLGDVIAIALIITRRQKLTRLPFRNLFYFYGATLLISIFAAPLWIGTTFAWWQFARMLLVFAAISGEVYRPEVRHHILIGLSLGLIYQAANVIPQKITGVVQATGTFYHQNVLGLAVELAVLPLIGAYLGGSRSKFIPIGIASALICVAGSGSRGTIALSGAAILALLVLSLIRRSTPLKAKAVAFAIVGLAIASPLAIATLNTRFDGGTFVTAEEGRETFERAAKLMSEDYPFGAGANQFVVVANTQGYSDRAGVSWLPQNRSAPVHNAYLLARAESGWLGQIAFFTMFFVPTLCAFRLAFKKRRTGSGELVLGCGVALATNMIHNNYEFAVHTSQVATLVFVNFSIIAAHWRLDKITKRRSSKQSLVGEVTIDTQRTRIEAKSV